MIDLIGGPDRDRTDDLFHAMEARSQLRHRPTCFRDVTFLLSLLRLDSSIFAFISIQSRPRFVSSSRPASIFLLILGRTFLRFKWQVAATVIILRQSRKSANLFIASAVELCYR